METDGRIRITKRVMLKDGKARRDGYVDESAQTERSKTATQPVIQGRLYGMVCSYNI